MPSSDLRFSFTKRLAIAVLALVTLVLFGVFTAINPAQAAERPFPKYEVTYQRIYGQKDPNYNPATDKGDGCIHSDNPQIGPLSFFGFSAEPINQCDGVRTTVRFYYDKSQTGADKAPTRNFRFGAVWHAQSVDMREGRGNYIFVPVQNFLFDGKPTDIYNAEDPIVRDKNGDWVRMNDGKGYYEPIHYEFDDEFEFDEEHTFQFDYYLPSYADLGSLTFGTGSTGDTQGGSIGAVANGMEVPIEVGMDVRYVLDSEYRAARGAGFYPELNSDIETSKTMGIEYPNRPLAKWSGEFANSTYTTISCLEEEGQQLHPVNDGVPINKVYPQLPFTDKITARAGAGTSFFAVYPYEYYLRNGHQWDSLSGLSLINIKDGEVVPYTSDDGSYKNLPYKPTPQSFIEDIPGYEFVGTDLPIYENGAYDKLEPEGRWPLYKDGPNAVGYYHKNNVKDQHFYYTYKPIKGSFELQKVAAPNAVTADKAPISGAEFELYEVVNTATSKCGVKPDLTGTEVVNICAAGGEAKDCEKTVRRVQLDDPIVTDENGKYAAPEKQLLPGDYLLKEVDVPNPYVIDNPWTQFTVPVQILDANGVVPTPQVQIENPQELTELTVTKQWQQSDGKPLDTGLPESIELQLVRQIDGKDVAVGDPVTVKPDAAGNWTHTFTELPKVVDGKDAVYSVTEKAVPGFTAKVSTTEADEAGALAVTVTNTKDVPTGPTPLAHTGADIAAAVSAFLLLTTAGLLLRRTKKNA